MADGRRANGEPGARFTTAETILNDRTSLPFSVLLLDRQVQHLAMGLGLECALTRLAREPEAFWTEILPADKASQYRLVAHARKDVRLFTGTMLAFTSWAYMHDVRYDRSEILCDAATHRPLVERDFAGEKELKGEYVFDQWLDDPSGAAPGRILATIPYEKDGKDQSLEMEARFHFAKPGVWLLDRMESRFRGEGGGSTGMVTVASATAEAFAPIREMQQSIRATEEMLAAIQAGPEGAAERKVKWGDWQPLSIRAGWTKEARDSTQQRDKDSSPSALLGLHRIRLEETSPGAVLVQLDGVSTVQWKEFETEWTVGLRDDRGRLVATAATNLVVRAEGSPAPFLAELEVQLPTDRKASELGLVSVEGIVERLSGAYHGHGLWFRYARPK